MREAARAMRLSVNTIKSIRRDVMRRIGLKTLADLVRWAIREKVIKA